MQKKECKWRRVAVGILLRRETVWVQKRPTDVHLPDLWEFPGGKVKALETASQALLRELREEVELKLDRYHLRLVWVRPYAYEDRLLQLYFFLVLLPRHQDPAGNGRWVPVEELSSYDFPPANAPVLRWLSDG